MNIAILGTGSVGVALGDALAAAGHAVTLGSRNPTPVDGSDLPVIDHRAAIDGAELVINAVPGADSEAFFTGLGAEVLDGKILLDPSNAVTPAFELMYPNSSVAEKLQAALPGTRVVKALNTVAAELMTAPATLADGNVFVSGDDAEAKQQVHALLTDLGWSDDAILDLGPIVSARGPEHYFPLFVAILQATGTRTFNIAVARGDA
jgi:hypothetical protein